MFNPLERPKVLFNDDCTKRFSTILQTSKQSYDKAALVLYRNNTISTRAPKDRFRPFRHRLWQNKSDKPFTLRELTIGVAKL
jgi:hypothetical protein